MPHSFIHSFIHPEDKEVGDMCFRHLFMILVMCWCLVTLPCFWPIKISVSHMCFRHRLMHKHSHSKNITTQHLFPLEKETRCLDA